MRSTNHQGLVQRHHLQSEHGAATVSGGHHLADVPAGIGGGESLPHFFSDDAGGGDLHALLAAARTALRPKGKVQVTVDIDPVALL